MNNRRAWFALTVLFGINLLNFFDRQLPGALGEPIRREFGLSDTALGFLGTIFTLIYAAVGVPLGRLTDRWIRTRLIAMGVTVWSVLTAASGLAWNYTSLFVSRLGVGVGEASCAPASQSLIGDLFPPHQRSRAFAVFMLGLPLGLCSAYFASGYIGSTLGWRAVFLLACIPGLLMGALALLIREPERGAADSMHIGSSAAAVASPYKAVLSIPTMWWIIASGALHNFNMYAINAFQTPFLQRFHEVGLREANNISAVVLGAVGVIGLLAGGWLGDRLNVHRPNGRMLLSALAMLAAAPCVYLAINRPAGELTSFTLLMGLGVMMTFVYYATIYAAIQDVVDPRLRGTAVALYFFAMYVLGASLGPVAIGFLSDTFALRAMTATGATEMTEAFKAKGLHDAMYVIPILMLLASLVLLAGSRTIAGDIRKRNAAGELGRRAGDGNGAAAPAMPKA
jgi:predicted MFS family arabinose efflux permease